MTNQQIINRSAVESGIYTKEEAKTYLQTRGELPLHTFQEWKSRGFFVKKGQKAKIAIKIWRFTREKVNLEEKTAEEIEKFYKTLAYFFTEEQVEKFAE